MNTRYVITSAIVLFVLLSLTLTAEAVACDPHCVVKGCDKKGCCYKGCHPNWEYRLKGCDCVPRCGGFCLDCISYRICRNCRVGYVVQAQSNGDRICVLAPKKTAIKCDLNCLSPTDCSTANTCNTKCKPTYGLTSTKTCGGCDINCDVNQCTANGGYRCDDFCKTNYIKDTENFCQSCDLSCTPDIPGNCDTPGTCSVCAIGFVANPSTDQCAGCGTNCNNCTIAGPGSCDADGCNTNSVYSSGVCEACDPNCDPTSGCSSPGTCATKCITDYGLTPIDTCGACDPNCDPTSGCSVKGANFCDTTCNAGYTLDSGMTGSYQCLACDLNCDPTSGCSVKGADLCDTLCNAGYILDEDAGTYVGTYQCL